MADDPQKAIIQTELDSVDKRLRVFDPTLVKDSELYQIATELLKEPRLDNNYMFTKLVKRLEAFYLTA